MSEITSTNVAANRHLEVSDVYPGLILPGPTKTLSFEAITSFSSYAPDAGPDNFHLSREAARRLGFSGVVAQAMMPFGFITEVLVRAFGRPALTNSRMTAKFIGPVVEGDAVTAGATVIRIETDGAQSTVILSTWCKNQRDETVTVGEAYIKV